MAPPSMSACLLLALAASTCAQAVVLSGIVKCGSEALTGVTMQASCTFKTADGGSYENPVSSTPSDSLGKYSITAEPTLAGGSLFNCKFAGSSPEEISCCKAPKSLLSRTISPATAVVTFTKIPGCLPPCFIKNAITSTTLTYFQIAGVAYYPAYTYTGCETACINAGTSCGSFLSLDSGICRLITPGYFSLTSTDTPPLPGGWQVESWGDGYFTVKC